MEKVEKSKNDQSSEALNDKDFIHIPQHGENVTSTGAVLAALEACSELTTWQQEVDVVAPDKVLRDADDGGLQRHFPVMVRGKLSHRTGQLCHFDFAFVVALEAGEEDLALTGLQSCKEKLTKS